MNQEFDVIIVGGGITGASIGYGLAKQNKRVAVIDEVPALSKASRANVGLIWFQCNGLGNPNYSQWTLKAVREFPEFAKELQDISGIEIGYTQSGGVEPTLGESGFLAKQQRNEKFIAQNPVNTFPVKMIERAELEKMAPKIKFGKDVSGGSFCEFEGWLEPLKLMFAVRKSFVEVGGTLIDGCHVSNIELSANEYKVSTSKGDLSSGKLVLAAGLGSRKLAGQLGFVAPIHPDGGHKLLFERVPNILPEVALQIIMRTRGGNLLFGSEHHHSWTSTKSDSEIILRQLELAVKYLPILEKIRLIRAWYGLRVMPNDGFPIYDKIPGHENGYIVAMHNAVTQSSLLQTHLADFVLGGELPEIGNDFRLSRFTDFKGVYEHA